MACWAGGGCPTLFPALSFTDNAVCFPVTSLRSVHAGSICQRWELPRDLLQCQCCRRRSVFHAEFTVNQFQMFVHGTRAEREDFTNLFICFTTRNPQQHFGLALCHFQPVPQRIHFLSIFLLNHFFKAQQILVVCRLPRIKYSDR